MKPSSFSKLQKFDTPTFQVPSCSTAVPTWFFRATVPSSRMLYFTVAEALVIPETLSTLAVAPELSDEGASDACENCVPSCSRLTRVATGVLPLKKVVQFFVIVAAVPVAAGDDDDGELLGGVLELGLLGLLLHAAMPAVRAHAAIIIGSDL